MPDDELVEAVLAAEAPTAAFDPPSALARFDLDGRRCRIVCVDDHLPLHQAARGRGRTRMIYIEHEVAHFELGNHRYALLEELELPHEEAPLDEAFAAGLGPDVLARLTNRELQIVQLICMGALAKQVADRLHLSEFTVRSYLKTIYCKLGVRSRGAMVYTYARAFARTRR